MKLERSWKALELAERHLELLEEVRHEPQEFTDTFVPSIAMIRRVGHAIDVESKGARTNQFGQWWSQSSKDPLLRCITDVRNLVFKGMGEGTQIRHEVLATDTATVCATAYNAAVATETTRISVVRDGQEGEEYTFTSTPISEPVLADPTYRRTWVFKGGECDGQELIPALHQYLEWMRDDVIPEAERLLGLVD